MPYSPVLTLHIVAGIMGILSGTAARSFRKGSPRHAYGSPPNAETEKPADTIGS